VIGCYTGLRFQDLTSISERNIKRDGDREILEFITNKTGERVVIPLSKTVKEIVRKYNYQLPKAICNQKFNAYLKFIGERAGLTDIVETVKTVGGSKQTFVFKKFELITTHTARRSFATNAFLDSMPTGMIMRMTGHKTEQVFRSYINVSQEENANAAAGNKFFSR
jgi:integrase